MNEEFGEFLEEFLNETEEHINTINNNLLEIEAAHNEGNEILEEKINALFRAIHTIKGLAGMLGFENIQELTHAMEDLMGEIRQGNLEVTPDIIDALFKGVDLLNTQIEEIKGTGSTSIKDDNLIKKLHDLRLGNFSQNEAEGSESSKQFQLDFLDFDLPFDEFVPSELEYNLLKEVVEKDKFVFLVKKEITGGISEEKFYKLPIFSDIEKVGELILFRPTLEEIQKSDKDSLFCYFIFSSEKPLEEIQKSFFDELELLRTKKDFVNNTSNDNNIQQKEQKMTEEAKSEKFVLADTGFDESIVSEFFEEVDELIENLDMSLLDLEKNPEDAETLNAIFRVAHTIKGASSMFGFEPIVKLTHVMENLFDNLRKGSLKVTTYIMDTFFEGVDLLKEMLTSLREEGVIDQDYMPVVNKINKILSGEISDAPPSDIKEVEASIADEKESSGSLNFSPEFNDVIAPEELQQIENDLSSGKTVIEISVTYPEDILKTNFKPFEGFFTGLEIAGDLVTAYTDISKVPLIDEFEIDKFYFGLKVILSSSSSVDDVKMLLSGFEDTLKMEFKKIEKVKPTEKDEIKQESKKIEEVQEKEEKIEEPKVKAQQKEETKKEVKASPLPPKQETKQVDTKKKKLSSSTIRVDIQRLDRLLNLVGEFVIDRTRFAQITQELREKYPHDPLIIQLTETNQIFGRHMNEIQEVIMSVRMVPIGNTFNKYPRIVRDLARESGKEINLEISGQETELDKTLVEEIGDPLVHLIRNAVDHGIETPEEREKKGKPRVGTIKLSAHHEGNHIVITIADDGKGIDPEKIRKKAIEKGLLKEGEFLPKKELLNLIFEPGFSTAEKVTNISGRGVGMDVVKRNITKLKGIIDIDTEIDKGTTITIKLPLTLAIIQVLMVQVESEIFAIPLPSIIETIRISKDEIQIIEGYEMITLRDSVLPIARLKDIFKLDEKKLKDSLSFNNELDIEETGKFFVVIVGLAEQKLGLIVDKLITQHEVVIKSLGELLSHAKGIAGATILGNGRVALILDIGEIMEDAKQLSIKNNVGGEVNASI